VRESSLKNSRIVAKRLAEVFKGALEQGKEKRSTLKPVEGMLQRKYEGDFSKNKYINKEAISLYML
jgi:hypothetical protein